MIKLAIKNSQGIRYKVEKFKEHHIVGFANKTAAGSVSTLGNPPKDKPVEV